MKTQMIILILLVSVVTCYAEDNDFPNNSGYSRFELMRIRDREERGFSNRGRIIYQYVDDSDIGKIAPNRIGTEELGPDSRVREVYVGVHIDKPLNFDKLPPGDALQIGTVETRQRHPLSRVRITTDLAQPINY